MPGLSLSFFMIQLHGVLELRIACAQVSALRTREPLPILADNGSSALADCAQAHFHCISEPQVLTSCIILPFGPLFLQGIHPMGVQCAQQGGG